MAAKADSTDCAIADKESKPRKNALVSALIFSSASFVLLIAFLVVVLAQNQGKDLDDEITVEKPAKIIKSSEWDQILFNESIVWLQTSLENFILHKQVTEETKLADIASLGRIFDGPSVVDTEITAPRIQRGLNTIRSIYGNNDKTFIGIWLNNLGVYLVLVEADKPGPLLFFLEARAIFEEALSIHLKYDKGENAEAASSYLNLAFLYFKQGDEATANKYGKLGYEIRKAIFGSSHPKTIEAKNDWLD